ncbi:MAG: hypothetical protein ICV73_20775, partial [Acetobacteraceae bacterium]|nr:hypothetical protein [Acetobacteraceae bacterium]
GAVVEIQQALSTVIRQVAASRNVNMVLRRELVIVNDPPFDLTAEVSEQLNSALRSVSIPPETAAAGGEAASSTPAARPARAGAQQQQGAGQGPASPPAGGQPAQRH